MSYQSTLQSSFKSPTWQSAITTSAKDMINTRLSNVAFIELGIFHRLPDLFATVYKKFLFADSANRYLLPAKVVKYIIRMKKIPQSLGYL